MARIPYRPEIDGLRAAAVLPVVLYHAGIPGFSGGFVGVDVFFVISGFLITSLITAELRAGTFSIIDFWERRVRRILPAMITVVLVSGVAAHFLILAPGYYKDFAESVLSHTFFASNIYFMRNADYFAAPSETQPLLHFWSLAVEEQFYIVFPVVLLLIFALRRHVTVITSVLLTTVAIASFALNVYLVDLYPGDLFRLPFIEGQTYGWWKGATNATAGFFLLPSRAWELCLGALLALIPPCSRCCNVVSLAGVTAIFLAVVFFDSNTSFPGFSALLPVLGAGAVIVATNGNSTVAGRMLSWPPIVWLGLISYSLYLWHWPIFVFAKFVSLEDLGPPQMLMLVVVSIGMAWLSYQFIESPVRRRQVLFGRTPVFASGFASLAVLAVAAILIFQAGGVPERLGGAGTKVVLAMNDYSPRRSECYTDRRPEILRREGPCLIGGGGSRE